MKKILKQKRIVIILSTLVIISIFLVGRSMRINKEKININLKKAKKVLVSKGDLKKELILTGKIDAQNYAVLRFQTAGNLYWLGVKEGDLINKWQAIASLDKKELQKRFEKELNNYLSNRWDFEDTQDQYKQTKENFLITPEIQRILDKKQFSLNNAVIDLELTDITLKYASLISPIKGIVTSIDIPTSGVNINPTNFSITVIDFNSIYFKTEADEEDISQLFIGQKAEITLDSFPDKYFPSEIFNISFVPLEGQTSTSYKIKLSFKEDNSRLNFKIGMNGDAKIILETKENVLIVPIESIIEEGNQKFVYQLQENNKVKKQEIKTGLQTDDFLEIVDGLKENETVVY